MDSLVEAVSAALSRPGIPSFGAAILWGLMSVLLSPCHLGSIPLIVGFIILCGLWLMDVPPLSRVMFSTKAAPTGRGASGALILGLIYGVILGPCSFAFLAPMIGVVFQAGGADLGFGIGLMASFALGHCAAIIAAGTFGDAVRAFLARRGSGTAATWFKRACGAVVVVAGAAQLLG
ncbi:MAG: hypothetical protein NT080_06685 [Spirochaetes bacterium]|nr:hypothetical protein [Spirochaetota bacterium]